jgi:Uma2 family endonuclease
MTQVTTREFKAKLSKFLKELPIEVTCRGKIIATVLPGGYSDRGSGLTVNQLGIKSSVGATPTPPTKSFDPTRVEMCRKHNGSMKMTCGCA